MFHVCLCFGFAVLPCGHMLGNVWPLGSLLFLFRFPMCVLIHFRTKGKMGTIKHVKPSSKKNTVRSKAVFLSRILFVICVTCLSLFYCCVCSLQPCDYLEEKGGPLGSLCVMFYLCVLSISHMVSLARFGT